VATSAATMSTQATPRSTACRSSPRRPRAGAAASSAADEDDLPAAAMALILTAGTDLAWTDLDGRAGGGASWNEYLELIASRSCCGGRRRSEEGAGDR